MPSVTLNEKQLDELDSEYSDYKDSIRNEYMSAFYKLKDASISVYKSGKVVFQGKNIKQFEKYITIDEDFDNPYDYMNTIGADEVGTGDTFGPIVCAAVLIPKEKTLSLKNIGVKDSKKLDDKKIIELAEIIIKNYKHKVCIVNDEIYNENYSKYNMNEMKALLHNQNITNLSKECSYDAVCLDEFVNRFKYFSYLDDNAFKDISFEMRGESKSTSVAASSIVARYYFLKEIERINSEYSVNVPKGSGIDANNYLDYLIENNKSDILKYIAKLNFKNVVDKLNK